jgi:hypothetical protein
MAQAKSSSLIAEARRSFHAALLDRGILSTDAAGIPSIADKHSKVSIDLASGVLRRLGNEAKGARLAGQMSGNKFESVVASYLEATFPKLSSVRCGKYSITKGDSRLAIAAFEQYEHLAALADAVEENPSLAVALGVDYLIKPDVMITRSPEPDEVINADQVVVDEKVARKTGLRLLNNSLPILHASISCKWTLRSDRAQNARSEALTLIRNRKGRLPHVVVITGEPTPGRLTSLALGTGDIDCVYHIALDELVDAVDESNHVDSKELLSTMIEGKRLRDISDLPLDLAT